MAQPTPYVPGFDFSGFQASNPTTPLPGTAVDAELASIALTTDEIIVRMAIIQRDDAELTNKFVHWDGLDDYVRNLLAQIVDITGAIAQAEAAAAASAASAVDSAGSAADAAASAVDADLSKSGAAGSALSASDSATLAANSAAAILATPFSTKFYATKADMDADASPAINTGGVVTNDPVPANNPPTIWRKSAVAGSPGWALGADRLGPMEAKIKPADELDIPPHILGITFASLNDMVGGGFDEEMNLWVYGTLHTQGGDQIVDTSDALFEVVTPQGLVALRVSIDGLSDFIPGSGGGTTPAALTPLGADIVHLLLRGQSLEQGAESVPAVSTVALGYGGLMFGGYGVRAWDQTDHPLNPELRTDTKFNLVPLAEVDQSGVGETVASGIVAQLKDMIVGHYKAGNRNTGQQILVSFSDQGGRFLDEIRKTPTTPDGIGAYYATAVDNIRRGKAAAAALGKTYSVLMVDFGQGEANGIPQMTRGGATLPWATFWPLYRDQLLEFQADMETDSVAITGQAGRIPLVSYLTEGPVVSHAQLLAGDVQPGLVQVYGPHYDLPTALNSHYQTPVIHGNEVHRSADGTRHAGCRRGKWIARQFLYGERIIPHRITGSRYIGSNQIIVDLQVPRPPVVIDTTWLPAQSVGMGFSIASGVGETAVLNPLVGGVPCLVIKCEIAGPAQLKLTLATALPAAAHLHYARLPTVDAIATPLVAYQDGAGTIYGYATKELVFAGSIKSTLQPLVDEGAFYANNTTVPRVLARALIIRSVVETGGQTKLIGQANELGAGAAFVAGDIIQPMRGDPFGNIRDSDFEYCPLTFSDTTYGTRAGQHYPLWNWLSTDLDVEIKL